MKPLFQGEVQLRRWSESSTQGVQVTFALADSDDLEPLKMKSGRRFACVLVEIADDETAVQEPPKEPIGPLCKWLVMRCAEPEFWAWINSETFGGVRQNVKSEADAKEFVCSHLMIDSRKEIDADPETARAFNELVRYPYQKWLVRRGG